MSTAVTVNLPHELGRAEARRRIEQGFDRIEKQFGDSGASRLEKSWEGDRLNFSMRFMGQGVTGALDVLEDAVRMEVHLPNLLGMIADKLKGRLKKEGQLLLEKK